MKGKKLTREMKILLTREGLDPNEWIYQKNTNEILQVCKKDNHKEIKIIEK